MKFAHDYVQTLDDERYPPEWVRSAISYRQLKKCIKKVRNELLALGLRPDILNLLWHPSEVEDASDDRETSAVGFRYSLPGECTQSCAVDSSINKIKHVTELGLGNRSSSSSSTPLPKLTFVVDSKDGTPLNAFLSRETREHIERLGSIHPIFVAATSGEAESDSRDSLCNDNGEEITSLCTRSSSIDNGSSTSLRIVDIPLYSDSEFFGILQQELSALSDLREQEQDELSRQVVTLRQDLSKVVNKSLGRKESVIYAWREIFRLYLECQIFFSTSETDSGQRSSAQAARQIEIFQGALNKENSVKKLRKSSRVALDVFFSINHALLRNLKFQEINQLALTKILKKFDKRTALHARTVFPKLVTNEPFLAQSMAKAICYVMSEEVVSLVPQLNDYLCPICFSVAFKPVRLRCNHVFCIRCLVLMQRAKQNQCALCRSNVVIEATGGMF